MTMMTTPGFTAALSLGAARGSYGGGRSAAVRADAVVPAIPYCGNCGDILENCANNGWRPRAVCNACYSGNCFSGEENPGGHCRLDHASGGIICDV